MRACHVRGLESVARGAADRPSREALHRASTTIAVQAEVLADEMECGGLADRGGPDALRLFAAVIRVSGQDELAPIGHA